MYIYFSISGISQFRIAARIFKPTMDLSTPCTESIGGGGTNNTDPTTNTTNNTDDLGKKRKHCNISTNSFGGEASLFKAYGSTSSDEKISLVILKQPEKQHRARYHTEGSRGAVKDRGQNGFPTVQLRGTKYNVL